MKRNTLAAAVALCLGTTAAASSACAAESSFMELLRVLRDNGTISAEAYQQLREAAAAEKSMPAEAPAKKEPAKTSAALSDRLQFKSGDGAFSMRIGGRVQADIASYSDDITPLGSGSEVRRARMFMQGKMWDRWGYKLEYDFTGSGIDGLTDAYMTYGADSMDITFGHFKEPFSLENMTSDKYVTFMERPLINTFLPGRNIGVGLSGAGESWSLGGGLTGAGVDGPADEQDEGYGGSARFTWAPVHEKGRVTHLGLSASFRDTGDAGTVRFRERPASHVTSVRLVDTGTFDADSFWRYAAEAAFTAGSLTLKGEYFLVDVDRGEGGNPDPGFSGYYGEVSWFPTGESLDYSVSSGRYGKVKPKSNFGEGGPGAWQLALRLDSIDLSDGDIDGGEERNLVAGINWYPIPNLRFMANYVQVLDVEGGPNDGDEPSVIQVRGAVEF